MSMLAELADTGMVLAAAAPSAVGVLALGVVSALVAVACTVRILVDAFQRSVGAGVMVALIPFFILYYAFAHFEHPRKGLVLAGLVGGWGLAVSMATLVTLGNAA
jgi:translocator protein